MKPDLVNTDCCAWTKRVPLIGKQLLPMLMGFWVVMSSPAFAEVRVAFLVGNSAYEHATPLRNPQADVELIATSLEALDFEVTTHLDLTRREIGARFSTFLRENSGADVTLFYFAGHGMQFNNRNFLLGTDAQFDTEFDIEAEALDLEQVTDMLVRNSKAAMVFIDACRNNPLATDFYTRNFSANRAALSQGLATPNFTFNGTMVTFSASPGQVAFDGEGDNSPFAIALARHLPAEDVEVLSLMKRVTGDVLRDTQNQQTPMVMNDLVTEIYLRRGDGDEAALIAYREEESLFDAARAINTSRTWDIYFQKYPNGRFHQDAIAAREQATVMDMASASGVQYRINTREALNLSLDAVRQVENEFGLTRDDIRSVQTALSERGHYSGVIDGLLGSGTRGALADFQLTMDLPSTGAITKGTAQALNVALEAVERDDAQFFSSRNARRYDPLQLALFEDDRRLLRAVEALRRYELLYGYFEGRLYIAALTYQNMSFEAAQALAQRAGGYLATISSAAENTFLYNLVRDDRRMWRDCSVCPDVFGPSFGLYQLEGSREPDGGFVWVTGEPVTYTNWADGEPGNHGGDEYFVAFQYGAYRPGSQATSYSDSKWGDMQSSTQTLLIEIE